MSSFLTFQHSVRYVIILNLSAPKTRPINIHVFPRTEQSVTVTWRGVSIKNDEESLLGYKVGRSLILLVLHVLVNWK